MRIIQSENPRPLNLLALGPGGLVAAACSTFASAPVGYVDVWDAVSGKERFNHCGPAGLPIGGVAFTSDGKALLVAEFARVTVVDLGVWANLLPPGVIFGNPEIALAASEARLLIASHYQRHANLECWSLVVGSVPFRVWQNGPHHDGIRFSKPTASIEGHRFAVAEQAADSSGRPLQHSSIRDANTGEQLISIPLDAADPVQQLAFTADGAKLLVHTDSRTVQMFDATTGAPAGELVHPGRPYVTGIAVHPRGPVACVRTNGTVTLWDADKCEQLRTLDWKTGKLVSVAFSPDGALGAAGTEDGKVVVWDVDI